AKCSSEPLMQLTTAEAEEVVQDLGASMHRGKDYFRGWIEVEGKIVAMLIYPGDNKPMPGHLPDLFRKALHLTPSEFELLRMKRMSRQEYIELLRMKGIL